MTHTPSITEESDVMLSYETKRKIADATLWAITGLWVGYPFVKGAWTILAGSFTGMLILETLLLTVGCAMASSTVTQWRDQLKTLEKKQLAPHKYDRDVLYWEEGDSLKLKKDEDSSTMDAEFVGFTDENTAVVKEDAYKENPPLHEVALPELENYKNEAAQDRKAEAEREELLAKVDNSYYNEKLDQLRKLENRKQEVMREIEEDPELAEFEENLDEDLPEIRSDNRETPKPELTRVKN